MVFNELGYLIGDKLPKGQATFLSKPKCILLPYNYQNVQLVSITPAAGEVILYG
jgi:hypothetical protein